MNVTTNFDQTIATFLLPRTTSVRAALFCRQSSVLRTTRGFVIQYYRIVLKALLNLESIVAFTAGAKVQIFRLLLSKV